MEGADKTVGYGVVGARGFEPPTPASRTQCATGLRYAPTEWNRNEVRIVLQQGGKTQAVRLGHSLTRHLTVEDVHAFGQARV